MSLLEMIAVAVSFLGIWLTAKRVMLCWPVNLVACALYFKLFLDVRLYADMALQAVFGLAVVYGWIVWARGKAAMGRIAIAPLAPMQAGAGLVAGASGALIIGWYTSHYTNAALPWLDAALSSYSLVAQFWTARRHAASWLAWIALDTVYVGMFVFKGLWLTAGLYAVMVGLAVVGYRRWHESARGGASWLST